MGNVANWILIMMMSLNPKGFDYPSYEEYKARETKEETAKRYKEIAEIIAKVVDSESPIFNEKLGKLKTAAIITSLASFESGGFRKDIDFGTGKVGRGDHGRSWCMMQIMLGKKKVFTSNDPNFEDSYLLTSEGWSGRDLLADREKCFRAGLRLVKKTWGCGPDINDSLSVYASGKCVHAKNVDLIPGGKIIREVSAQRVGSGIMFFYSRAPKNISDEEFFKN